MRDLLSDISMAFALLKAHNVVPDAITITRTQFERLKAACHYPDTTNSQSSIFGCKLIVLDENSTEYLPGIGKYKIRD